MMCTLFPTLIIAEEPSEDTTEVAEEIQVSENEKGTDTDTLDSQEIEADEVSTAEESEESVVPSEDEEGKTLEESISEDVVEESEGVIENTDVYDEDELETLEDTIETNTYDASYPFVISAGRIGETYERGKSVIIPIVLCPEYHNERYDVRIYRGSEIDESKLVASASDTYYNSDGSSWIRRINIEWNIPSNIQPGEYTVAVKLEFYSWMRWNEAPRVYTVQKFITDKYVRSTSVKLNKKSLQLEPGEEFTLNASVLPANASNPYIVSWSSSDESVATVSLGDVTAKSEGTAVITVESYDGTKATCRVTVKSSYVPVSSISFKSSSYTVMKGRKETLVPYIEPVNATNKSCYFESSDTSIATVDSNGVVTGLQEGVVTITAYSNDNGGYAKCNIIVSSKKNGLIEDSDKKWRLYRDDQVRTSYTGLYPYGTSLFYLNKGVLDTSFEGIAYFNGAPYYVVKGKVTYNYTGLGEYKGSLHYFTNSVKDESFNGICYYKNEPYFVVNGKVTYNYTGLGEYKGSLHYFTNSKKDTKFSGISYYEDEPYYVLNGIVTYKYTGIAEYKGSKWYVINSYVDKSFSGKITWKGKTYNIRNGKVQ